MICSLLLPLGLAASCSDAPPADTTFPVGTIDLQSLAWTSAPANLGDVQAVAEAGDDLAIYGDRGVSVYSSGTSIGSDNGITAWRGAAVVPALGFSGTWLLGIDGEGRLYRLRNQTNLEEVTALYGLGERRVQAVLPLGGARVALSIDDQLAVNDGVNLIDYPLALRSDSGGSGRIASVADGQINIFDVASGNLSHIAATGIIATAITADGQLWAATADELFRETGGNLEKIFAVQTSESITGLVAAGGSLWLSINDSLAVVRDGKFLRGAPGTFSAGTRLWGSPTGDIWSFASGTFARIGDAAGAGADAVYWRENLWPIFERTCQACHLPGGSARIDLSTYGAWASRRALIEQRVVRGQPSPMPPLGSGTLTPAELDAVSTWAAR